MRIIASLIAFGLLAASAAAAEKESSFSTFFKNLRDSLAKSAVAAERKANRGGSVAAVRGASQSSSLADPNEVSIKGDARSRRAKKIEEENAELEKAAQLAVDGKTDEALKAFEDFKTKHPKSSGVKKADEAIAMLKAQKAGGEAPAPAAEPAKN